MITHTASCVCAMASLIKGYVYYGKYAEYFEVGRVETVRAIGIPYKLVEKRVS